MIDFLTGDSERYQDGAGLRRKSVASDIANADTPGCMTQDIDSQARLAFALGGGRASLAEVSGLNLNNGGSNYDFISD